ncbi:MAG: hypothetical protein HY432_00730 [Candidatus Liptonbacteria bacterium]|nr:hypothetical protein [Candidatus Liptonbacteria bacterium]
MRKILEHKAVGLTFVISLLFVLSGWIWTLSALRNTHQPLIVHFNNVLGINQIGGLKDLSAVAIFGIVSLLFDFVISIEFDKRDKFLGKFTAAAGLFFSILIFIGFAAIISVN